jgi:hypothetical protein
MSPGAGYSGTPLARKLGIREGHRVALLHPPRGFADLLEGLPEGVAPVTDPRGQAPFDVVVLFTPDAAALEKEFGRALKLMDPHGGLWISWPKKSSPLYRDLTEDVIRAAALAAGVVDNKVCAVDETWSALRLVIRVADRPFKQKQPSRRPRT